MNIVNVAYPLFPVSANAGGGSEQILYLLDRGLVAAGHRSIVVAAKGSRVSGSLIATPVADGEITDDVRRWAQEEHRRTILDVLSSGRIDLVHFHGLDFHQYAPDSGVPKLVTLHLPVGWYPESIFQMTDIVLNFVSKTQAGSRSGPIICNGIDVEQYRQSYRKEEFLLTLSRICPEKGIDIALRVAHRLGLPMTVAGPVHAFASHQRYFQEQVEPLLDTDRRYAGPAGLEQKKRLLGSARCLLVPSLAQETSSLVAMEAIASGTPVIAFRSGALPEVVDDGLTGFLVSNEEEMAEAVLRIGEISPETCRRRAQERFSSDRMIREYLSCYHELVSAGVSR